MNNQMKLRLSAESLLDKVSSDVGLSDFGDNRFISDYQYAINALAEELPLTSVGITILEGWLERILTNRLRMQRDLKEHPEIHDEILSPPVVICGSARTGSSKLQRLLSVSPATQSLQLWKLLNPAPFPNSATADIDPRITYAEEVTNMTRKAFPDYWAAHPTPPLDAEEDFLLHDMTFLAPTNGMQFGASELTAKLTPIDIRVYEFLRTALKYLQWQDGSPDRASRPWVLKSPIHIGNISTLLQVFPGARFIFCHRDIEIAIASLCSTRERCLLMYCDNIIRDTLGTETLDYWAEQWNRNLQQRAGLQKNSYCDIRFDEINRDGVAIAERMHAFAGLVFDADARQATKRWEAQNPRHHGGRHDYKLEDYGLSSAQVREAFAPYYTYFSDNEITGEYL